MSAAGIHSVRVAGMRLDSATSVGETIEAAILQWSSS
jgi:hypothetical protein